VHDAWDRREGDVSEKIYAPEFPEHAAEAQRAGHGGGDFFTNFHFARAIRSGEPPYLDVYRGLAMSMVGIQAWRSCLADGMPFEVPDFRQEAVRAQYAEDDWSPYPEDRRPGQPWPSIEGDITPSNEAVAFARQVWSEMGYHGE
ncbi:MAG TPA: hypothetical protein VHR86_01110, partial [Armatimonadota bacterium]|nr:hypothetical protein [Armatimonadota bacterium]